MDIYTGSLLHQHLKKYHALADKSIEQVFIIARKKKYRKGEIVLKEGQVCKTVFFVEEGYLNSSYNKDGIIINTAFSFEGDFTTSLKSLQNQKGSDVLIKAGEDAVTYEFDKAELIALYEYDPDIACFGRRVLEQILLAQEEHGNLFRLYAATERYRYIVENYPHYLQRISLTQLASYLGLTRETLTRIRRKS